MIRLFFLAGILLAGTIVSAQSIHHKIIFDLVDSDTATQSAVLRQFNSVLKAAPDAELELVCHGNAVNMFLKNKIVLADRVKELKSKGNVSFKVCANSLKRLQLDPSDVSDLADIVPVAILELSARQQEGWSYIKAGH